VLPLSADETRLAEKVLPPKGGSHGKSAGTSSGWSSSTTDIDHGRFQPGAILDDRYRIVGRLGRGGMGEVYRADDLKLAQPVALKFLPESVDRDPARLTQLHTEVRMARQVSHPNVCRVYDVGEFDGHTFLSMEFVDGEDLASLLRRVGRLQEERAIELARQICAGLAAAHDRGVVHRDLKPANVMLDGGGRIRITDFGLAGATGEVLRAGTPAYMAPEQLAGGEVTPRSDIYALGLVCYELFTGKRAIEAASMPELIAKREQGAIVPPADVVRGLDDRIDRAIMRCLDPDPLRRPPSALAVAAALPGGDPLAAALAAGETPSPDMVAAAGSAEAVSPLKALAGAAWIVASLVAVTLLYQRVMMLNVVDPPKPPEALVDRAQEIVQKLGYGSDVHATAAGLGVSLDWANDIDANSAGADRWTKLHTARPETFYLWYRTSPRALIPFGNENPVVGINPPLTISGMTLAVVDIEGRLTEFHAVPSPAQQNAAPFTAWPLLFDLAGLPMRAFAPAVPSWVPTVHAEQRVAWEGRIPEIPDHTVRVEAGATAGRPVFFVISGSWTRSARSAASPRAPSLFERIIGTAAGFVMPALMLIGPILAYRNVKLGRGDRRGAFRAAAAVFFLVISAWLLGRNHVASVDFEQDRLFNAIGRALWDSALLWLTYLGLEPYIRRFSPDSLIGWQRLVSGRWRDPRVGRDLLVGTVAGMTMTLVFAAHNPIARLLGHLEPMPVYSAIDGLMALRYTVAGILSTAQSAISNGMLGTAGFVVLRILLKRRVPTAIAAVLCFFWVVLSGMFSPGWPLLDLICGLAITTGFVLIIGWAGLLATISALFTHFLLLRAPLTTHFSSWRGDAGLVIIAAVLAVGLCGAYLASQPARVPIRA
jgi:serine/threonine-protein kinase